MRKLAVLALLALSLFTVACTDSEDEGTDFEAASIDDVDGLAVDGETDSLSERGAQLGGAADTADRLEDGVARPAHAPSGEPLSDRIGANGLGTAPGQPGTGTAECLTATKLANGEPVVGAVSPEVLGARAAIRYQHISKLHVRH